MKVTLKLLFTAIAILFCQIETVGETNYDEQQYIVDTFFVLKYGKGIGMLSSPLSNPWISRATENNTYVLQSVYKADDTALIIDRNGKFIEKKKMPIKPLGLYSWEEGLVITDSYKMYYADWNLNIIDSINYKYGDVSSPLFCFEGNIFFEKPDSKDTILKYDIKKRLYSDIGVHSVWGIELKKSGINPFNLDSLWGESRFVGASNKIIVFDSTDNYNMRKIIKIFDVSKGVVKVLANFDYFINLTPNSGSALQFIDDTTAIFNVLYKGKRDTCLDQRDCEEYKRSPSSNPESIIRFILSSNRVFYRIKFLMN